MFLMFRAHMAGPCAMLELRFARPRPGAGAAVDAARNLAILNVALLRLASAALARWRRKVACTHEPSELSAFLP